MSRNRAVCVREKRFHTPVPDDITAVQRRCLYIYLNCPSRFMRYSIWRLMQRSILVRGSRDRSFGGPMKLTLNINNVYDKTNINDIKRKKQFHFGHQYCRSFAVKTIIFWIRLRLIFGLHLFITSSIYSSFDW